MSAAPFVSGSSPDLSLNHKKIYFPKSVDSPTTKIENALLITNNSNAPVIWKMRRSPNTPFLVHPTSGVIYPKEERRVSITCTGEQLQPLVATALEKGSSWSEKLQLNARFFHESDNRENVAECWNNKAAEAAMKKLKLDLPVVFAEGGNIVSSSASKAPAATSAAAPAAVSSANQQQQQQQPSPRNNTSNPNDDSTVANAGTPARSSNNTRELPTTNTAPQQQQQASSPQASRPGGSANNNNTNNNQAAAAAAAPKSASTDVGQSMRNESSMQSVAQTTSAPPSPKAAQQQQQQTQQQQQSNNTVSSNNIDSAAPPSVDQQPAAKKKTLAEKLLLATMPIYVFVPLLLAAFALGAKVGGSGEAEKEKMVLGTKPANNKK